MNNWSRQILETPSLIFSKEKNPLWKQVENLNPYLGVKWVDRFSPMEAVAAEWALAMAYEQLSGYVLPKRSQYLRSIALEIQRMVWSYNYLGKVFSAIGDELRKEQAFRDREICLDMLEYWSGGRVLPQLVCLGGVEKDMSLGAKQRILNLLKTLSNNESEFYLDLSEDLFLVRRMNNLMPLTKEQINLFGLDGFWKYSLGISEDFRNEMEEGVYSKYPVEFNFNGMQKRDTSDAFDRLIAVKNQLKWSRDSLELILKNIPEGDNRVQVEHIYVPSDAFVVTKVAAPSGWMYASFIYGKISIQSSSTRLARHIDELLQDVEEESKELAFYSLGIDPIQGGLI